MKRRRSNRGAYVPVKTALHIPAPLPLAEVEDLAHGVELLTDRVVDIHPCRPNRAFPFAHHALWIIGKVSNRRIELARRLINEQCSRSARGIRR